MHEISCTKRDIYQSDKIYIHQLKAIIHGWGKNEATTHKMVVRLVPLEIRTTDAFEVNSIYSTD